MKSTIGEVSLISSFRTIISKLRESHVQTPNSFELNANEQKSLFELICSKVAPIQVCKQTNKRNQAESDRPKHEREESSFESKMCSLHSSRFETRNLFTRKVANIPIESKNELFGAGVEIVAFFCAHTVVDVRESWGRVDKYLLALSV